MGRLARHFFFASAWAVLLSACTSAPADFAVVGNAERGQRAEFRRLFDLQAGPYDVVLKTTDLSEEISTWEKTLLVAFRNQTHDIYEFTSLDRKKMGDDRVRHRIAAFWSLDLRQDPSKAVVVLADAAAEFKLPGEDKNAKGAEPGITALTVDLKFLMMDRNGKIAEVEQRPGEAAGAFAAILSLSQKDDAEPVPLHWQLLFRYALSEKLRESEGTESAVKAATGYQWILDTIAHAKAGPDSDELPSEQNDITNPDYIEKFTRKRLGSLK